MATQYLLYIYGILYIYRIYQIWEIHINDFKVKNIVAIIRCIRIENVTNLLKKCSLKKKIFLSFHNYVLRLDTIYWWVGVTHQ